jgi:hypothetical protein
VVKFSVLCLLEGMRKNYPLLLITAFVFFSTAINGQSIGIGTSNPNASAQLDISSSSRGLLIPRMDSNAVKAIVNPAAGLMVYDSSRNQLLVNMGTAAAPDWENIVAKSGWSLTGNVGTGGTAVLGTTDQTPLVFLSNKLVVGSLDVSGNNVGFGYAAMHNGGCYECVAIGNGAQQNGANGSIAIGYEAMASNTGSANIGLGQQALENSTGSNNMAIGLGALYVNTGQNNIAFGNSASTFNTSGSNNVAVGTLAMEENNTGQSNTAVGTNALQLTSNSWYNTVVGANSGQAYDNGYNNVFVGANNDVNGAGYFNVIAIGQGVICTASSQARVGNSATNSIGGYADWTNFSDGRYKRNMKEDVKGLDFIMRLRPFTYNLDVTAIRGHLGQKAPTDEGTRRSIAEREAEVLSGFAAQEVEVAAAASGYTFSGVDKPKNEKDFYGLRYGDFVVPLVKAVQEQQKMIEDQRAAIEALQKRLDEQERLIRLIKNK